MDRKTLWLNYFRPNAFARDLSDINIHTLKISGVKLIICDLDNTLVPHFNKFPTKYAYEFISRVNNENIDLIIASNNSKKRVKTFVDKLSENVKIKDYIWNCKKPFTRKLKKNLKLYSYSKDDIIVIGDQFLTDIFLSNRLKVKSILVLPLVDLYKVTSYNFFSKSLEKYIYKKLQHQTDNSNFQLVKKNDIKIKEEDKIVGENNELL